MKVIKLDGKVIHIGEWDYFYQPDENGDLTIIGNPLPSGAVEVDEGVDTLPSGARVAASDYATKRREEYPTIQAQLDAMYRDKEDGTTTWFDSIKAVKDRHPKPV